VRVSSLEKIKNGLQNSLCLRQYFMIPEPQNREPFSSQGSAAPFISGLLFRQAMLPTIEFHNQSDFHAGKVSKIDTHRILAPELAT